MPLSANISTGLVKGRFGDRVVAGPNGDRLLIPARGRIDFVGMTPITQFPTVDPPVTMLRPTATGILDSEGYLCTPDATDPSKPGERMVLMQAPNDPDSTVRGWTWRGTPRFVNADGTRVHNSMEPFTFDLPFGDVPFDLAHAVDVPESVGIGTEQAIILAASAQAHAASADAAAEAAAADARVAREGVAEVVGALPSKADLIDGKVPEDQLPPAVGVTDEVVAPLVDMPETAAKIDARVAEQVAGKLDADTADATFQTKTDAAGLPAKLADATTPEGKAVSVTVASRIGSEMATPGSPARVAADAVYVSGTPLGAESIRTAEAQALMSWRAALANRDFEPARILFVGDSRTEGEGVTDVSRRWQDRVAAALRSRFPVAGGNPGYAPNNYVPVKYNSPTLAGKSLWSTPSAGHSTANSFGLGARHVVLGVAQSTTLTFTGTSCKLSYRRSPAAGAFTYVVDGGTAQTVSWVNGAEQEGVLVPIGPLAPGIHTVTVTCTAGLLSLHGAYVYNGEETKGIQVFDAGKHGVNSTTVVGAGLSYYKTNVANVNPHCVYIGIGTNDQSGSIPVATFETNIRALITGIKEACTLPPSIVLAIDAGRTSGAGWGQYTAALRRIAADNPSTISVLDLSARMPSLSDNALGLYADSLHEGAKGQAFRADVLVGYLSPS